MIMNIKMNNTGLRNILIFYSFSMKILKKAHEDPNDVLFERDFNENRKKTYPWISLIYNEKTVKQVATAY